MKSYTWKSSGHWKSSQYGPIPLDTIPTVKQDNWGCAILIGLICVFGLIVYFSFFG